MEIHGADDPVAFALVVGDFAVVQPCSAAADPLWVSFASQQCQ